MGPAREGFANHGEVRVYTTLESPELSQSVDSALASGPRAPVLLISGSGSTSVTWQRSLVDAILAAGHPVVRFDHRDVGRSTRLAPNVVYTLADLGADALAVLDHWSIERVHIIGRSMGGAVALEVALAVPARVMSLTLVYSSAALMGSVEGLAGPDAEVQAALAEWSFAPPPRSTDDWVERRVTEAELLAGDRYPIDTAALRAEAEADALHAPYAEHGHASAVVSSADRVQDLGSVACPALVLHGTADPIVPVDHGRLLAERIPGATLLEYAGLGHEMPEKWCVEIAPRLVRHLRSSETS